jgi:hypothetical protein
VWALSLTILSPSEGPRNSASVGNMKAAVHVCADNLQGINCDIPQPQNGDHLIHDFHSSNNAWQNIEYG